MRTLCSLFTLIVAASVGAAEENWPEHRGPHGDGRSDARGLPVTWSEKDNVRWKTPIHDKGWSSPVVWGDQIWLTTASEEGKPVTNVKAFAVCVDRKSGKIVHDLKIYDLDKPAFCHPFNSYASPTPVIEEGRVYLHFGTYGTCCLDTATGKKLWDRDRREFPCDHFRGPGASPILSGNLLILTFDGYDLQYVVALDKATGKTVWKKDRGISQFVKNGDACKAYSTPAVIEVGGKPQIISPGAYATMAYDPATGDELWRVSHGGMNASARPLFAFGKLFLTSGDGGMQLLTVRPDGKGEVAKSHVDWTLNKGVPTRSSLVLVDDLLYMVSNNGIASGVEAKTGRQVWQQRLGKNYCASPIYAGGHLYFSSQEGAFHVLEASREGKILATNNLDEGCMASPAAVGKSLLVRTRTHLYCLETK